jgi:Family of unknown function (DUF6279)
LDRELHRFARSISMSSCHPNDSIRVRFMVRRLTSIACVLFCVGAASGCGVKTVYNNLDRLIKWSMDDYMKLDDAQQDYFQAELDTLLYWHRTTQLPIYARELRQLDASLADGATVEELFVFRTEVEAWWDAILQASLPMSTELLYSATDAQLDQFALQFAKDARKYVKPYEKLTPDARRARWAREFRDYFERFTGNLNKDQKNLIEAYSARFTPDDESWAEYRKRYGLAMVALVRERQPYVQFSRAFRDMTFGRERWYGDEYAQALASNQDLYRDVTLALLDSLTSDQRKKLSNTLQDVAKDFDELALDAPAAPPAEACLLTC